MKLRATICAAICATTWACATTIVQGQLLFSENWDTGSIDSTKWSVRGTTPNAIALELPQHGSPGDYALTLRGTQDTTFPGTSPTWFDNIMSKLEFRRTDQVTMEFKAWNKPGTNAQIGVHGGFHHPSVAQTQQHYAQDLLCTPEATFDYFVNEIRASESGDFIQGGPGSIDATAAIKANTKNGAATFRVTLDVLQGALWELIIPATNPAHSTGAGDPEVVLVRDTRGIANFGERTGSPTEAVNDQVLNAIGFGQGGVPLAGTTFVDDILVYGPNGPGGASPGNFDGDQDVDGHDFILWQRGFGGTYDGADYADWASRFGGSGAVAAASSVPEPASALLVLMALAGWRTSRSDRP